MADARKHRAPQVAARVWKRRGPPVVADMKAVLREVAAAAMAAVGPPAVVAPPAADTTGRIASPWNRLTQYEPTDGHGGLFLFTNIYQG
jgi:hypothetical protein